MEEKVKGHVHEMRTSGFETKKNWTKAPESAGPTLRARGKELLVELVPKPIRAGGAPTEWMDDHFG